MGVAHPIIVIPSLYSEQGIVASNVFAPEQEAERGRKGGRHKLIFFSFLFEDYAKSGPVAEGVERKARQRAKTEDAAAGI